MAQYEKLAGMALGVKGLDLEQTEQAFVDYLVEEDWEKPPESYDWEGEYLRATIVDYGDHGRWIFLEELPSPRPELAREFAATLDEPLRFHQVSVTEKYSREKASYDIDRRSREFTPDGESRDLDVDAEPQDEQGYGDLYETAGAVLGQMVHDNTWSPVSKPKTVTMYKAELENEDGLDPRIRELAGDLEKAGSYEVVEMSGQQMLRFELPDGTRQMSRISPEELETLKEMTGVSPT